MLQSVRKVGFRDLEEMAFELTLEAMAEGKEVMERIQDEAPLHAEVQRQGMHGVFEE